MAIAWWAQPPPFVSTFDFDHVDHTFGEIIQGGWLTSHQPNGTWLYGADISVHPEYRGRGLATALYAARQEVVWRLGLKGQVTAGMIPGYGAVKDNMTAEEYYRRRRYRRVSRFHPFHADRCRL